MGLIHEIDYGTPVSKSEKPVTLTVDGFEVTVPEGTSIMRASMEAGIAIPASIDARMMEVPSGTVTSKPSTVSVTGFSDFETGVP